MVDPHIGKRLKECRQKAGISQTELAQITGMGVPAISNIERGSNYPTVDNLITIMKTIGASPNYIFQDVLVHSFCLKESGDFEALPEAKKQQLIKITKILWQDELESDSE